MLKTGFKSHLIVLFLCQFPLDKVWKIRKHIVDKRWIIVLGSILLWLGCKISVLYLLQFYFIKSELHFASLLILFTRFSFERNNKICPKIIPPKFEKNVRKYFRRSFSAEILSAEIFGC